MSIPVIFSKKKIFTPKKLFAAGEQGVWYDPSDFSTLFQDSAGTTPVTAIEQPVGLILDKSGRGNHAFQPTTTSRPILRNLYNLLTYTEQFNDALWAIDGLRAFGSGSTVDATTAPDGTVTADLITENSDSGNHRIYGGSTPIISGATYTTSIYVKNAVGSRYFALRANVATGVNGHAIFDLQGQTYNVSSSVLNPFIDSVGNGWFRVGYSFVAGTGALAAAVYYLSNTNIAPAQNSTGVIYTGDNTSGVYIWGAQLVPANEASIPYQRVVTNTPGSGVYDTDLTKFKPYLFFDGSDDWLRTANINFSATDKITTWLGFRWLSSTGLIYETGTNSGTVDGTFAVTTSSGYLYQWVRGTALNLRIYGTYSFPGTHVATTQYTTVNASGLSQNSFVARVDGVSAGSGINNNQAVSSGNFGTQPLYIGRRAGAIVPWQGRIYSLLIRGTLTSSPQLERTENWVNSKTGAY